MAMVVFHQGLHLRDDFSNLYNSQQESQGQRSDTHFQKTEQPSRHTEITDTS